MSVRLEMLQVARLAPRLLGDAAESVAGFLHGQQNADGGFNDRAGNSDLYYTVFGIEALFALRASVPMNSLQGYLRGWGAGESLDFVHLCCLARCWAMFPPDALDDATGAAILSAIESHRSADGGYHAASGSPAGTVYACFLATAAYQDLRREAPNPSGIIHCMETLQAGDGGYANQQELPMGLTPSTAAAVTLLRQYDRPIDAKLGDWLLSRAHPEGGFFATPAAPIPDLLSTATALHALAGMQRDTRAIREGTLDFIDTLWNRQGAFFGNWEDDVLDCEYTYYALLALGHLSV
ncbi:MAG TPA: prenyltransferase/squalene oxidase repeat-containing protein [Tepidisphaeraceae bacterium]|nr:prenyltransferase/squalene oxidase repeat-containing protein [Tepidisphaeraceae bacterium]